MPFFYKPPLLYLPHTLHILRAKLAVFSQKILLKSASHIEQRSWFVYLFDVFALATGATLSGGFFLLPGLASVQAGSLMFLSYLIAAVPLFPAMLSKVELATAMPRSGGVYYFLDRSLGPLFGTIGGIGIWLTLLLKVSFALIGMGAYLSLFVNDLPMKAVAIVLAALLGVVNIYGTKKARLLVGLWMRLLLTLCCRSTCGSCTYSSAYCCTDSTDWAYRCCTSCKLC